MLHKEINRIRNPRFGDGRSAPSSWRWEALGGVARWRFDGVGVSGDGRVVVLETDDVSSGGQCTQSIRCRSNHDYRIEVLASCRLGRGATGGLGIHVETFGVSGAIAHSAQWNGPWRSSRPVWWRMRYRTPRGATRMEIGLRLEGGKGTAELHCVRAIPMDYLSGEPHPVSVPPWPYVYGRPRRVRSIRIVEDFEDSEHLASILRARFGKRGVGVVSAGEMARSVPDADALFVGGASRVPRAITWKKIVEWARDRIIVVSLPVFEQLVNRLVPGCVRLAEHVQMDDILGVRVDHAGFITNGFALKDVLEFSEFDERTGGFRQRQMIRSAALRRFMTAESLVCVLSADTNMDASSGRPTCLHKETPGGAVVVMDCKPLLSAPTNEANSNLAAQLLMNVLGADTVSVGQFTDPRADESARGEQLLSLTRQVPGMNMVRLGRAAGDGAKAPHRSPPLITVGRNPTMSSFAAPPALLIRSGVDSEGRQGYDGALAWIKSLGRKEPCVPRYAPLLLSQRSVMWVPCAASVRDEQLAQAFGNAPGGLVVDVCEASRNRIRVVTPSKDEPYCRYFDLLGELDGQLRRGRMFGWLAAGDAALADRDSYAWRSDEASLEIVADPDVFRDRQAGLPSDVRRVRLEVPAAEQAGSGLSIVHTEQAALLLEWIAGLEIGLVAVNRDPDARRLRFKARALAQLRGPAMLIEADGHGRQLSDAQRAQLKKSGLRIPPGATLLIQRGDG